MNKGIRGSVMALVFLGFLFPQLALAAWWNPFSWFNDWAFLRYENSETEELETRVQELEGKLEDALSIIPPPTAITSPIATTSKETEQKMPMQRESQPPRQTIPSESQKASVGQTVLPFPILDVCSNIEGIQTTVPQGFTAVGNLCNLAQVDDKCPNLPGVQATVPDGRVYSSTFNKCVTENELTRLENTELAKEEENEACLILSDEIAAFENEFFLYQKETNDVLEEMEKNPQGMEGTALNTDMANYRRKRDVYAGELQDLINLKRSQWNRECLVQ